MSGKTLKRRKDKNKYGVKQKMADSQRATGEAVIREGKNSNADTDIVIPTSSVSDADDPDVPSLERTDSIFLTTEYLKSLSQVSEASETLESCSDDGDDNDYIPVKETSSEGSDSSVDEVLLVNRNKKKSLKAYRRKSVRTKSSSEHCMKSKFEDSETNHRKVSVMKLEKKKDGGRVYSKRHYCFFCSVKCHKMARHLIQKHKSEPAVEKAISFPLKSKERKLHFDLIRNRGNRAHNMAVLKTGSGTLIPSQQTGEIANSSDYMHCINCQALLKRKSLWRHMSRCRLSQKSTAKPGKSRVQSLCSVAQPVPDGINIKVWQLVNAMHQDDVTQIVREEKSILKLGEHLYSKHGHDKTKHEYIRQKMREVGRLLLCSQEAGTLKKIEDFFVPSKFKLVVEAVKNVAGFDDDKNMYKTPSLALKLGHSLKKIADILECEAKMAEFDNEEFLKDLERSRSLYEKKWDVCVSSRALQTLREGKWNTTQMLPFTEDVKIMHMHLDKYRKEYQTSLDGNPNKKNWSKLAILTLCEVILFNRRREGEVSKMPLTAFTQRDTSGVHSDVAQGLSEFEKKLCQYFQRIEIRGKRNRKVPVLLTPDMFSSMEALVAHRQACGVPDENPFFFGRPDAQTNLRGSDAIRMIAKECGAKHPETLSSTKLRKHVSTLSTVLNLKDNEMDILANFLGHDIRVHREYYRLPEGTLELAKVSKVLIALEQGRLTDFKGMSLDQIQINPNEDVLEDVDSDLSEMETSKGSTDSSTSGSNLERRQPASECSVETSSLASSTPKITDTESDLDTLHTESNPSSVSGTVTMGSDSFTKPGPSGLKRVHSTTDEPDDGDLAVSGRSKKRAWDSEEVRAVEKTLMPFIQSGKVPGKSECTACIKASPEALKNRSWTGVKFYVKNRITTIQRRLSKRM